MSSNQFIELADDRLKTVSAGLDVMEPDPVFPPEDDVVAQETEPGWLASIAPLLVPLPATGGDFQCMRLVHRRRGSDLVILGNNG